MGTKWMGDLNDRTFFTEARYEAYRKPGGNSEPLLAHAHAPLRRRGVVSAGHRDSRAMEGAADRGPVRASALADHGLAGRDPGGGSGQPRGAAPSISWAPPPRRGRRRLTVRVDNRYVVPVESRTVTASPTIPRAIGTDWRVPWGLVGPTGGVVRADPGFPSPFHQVGARAGRAWSGYQCPHGSHLDHDPPQPDRIGRRNRQGEVRRREPSRCV